MAREDIRRQGLQAISGGMKQKGKEEGKKMGFMEGQLGFDLFSDKDFSALTPITSSKAEATVTKSKAQKRASTANNKGKTIMFTKPVQVYGRYFRYVMEGEGEISLQALVEELYKVGYTEVTHENLRFYQTDAHTMLIVYADLRATDKNTVVSLPVAVVDGMVKASYSEPDELGVDEEDDELTVETVQKAGLSYPFDSEFELSYDASSSIAVPVYDEQDSVEKAGISGGSMVIRCGEEFAVEDVKSLEQTIWPDIPEKTKIVYCKAGDNTFFSYLRPDFVGGAIKIDRAAFGVKNNVTKKVAEEKILLPVQVYFANFNTEEEVGPEDMDNKDSVTWEQMLKYLKGKFRILNATDRKIDHLYENESNRLSVFCFSGTKGGWNEGM